jgi:hypothetical protein
MQTSPSKTAIAFVPAVEKKIDKTLYIVNHGFNGQPSHNVKQALVRLISREVASDEMLKKSA